jgi:abortive infection bacteriophage resistance protein
MPNQIIDINNTVIELEKKNLKIDDLGLLKYYIKNYNINTFLVEYSQFFIDEATDKFIDTSSNELIELYRFDKNFGNHLFRNILVLEKMINTNIAYNVINHYNLQDKCLLNLKRDDLLKRVMKNFHNITPPIMFDGLLIKMTRYLDAKKPIRKYMDRKIRDRVFQ